MTSPVDLIAAVKEANRLYHRGAITQEELYAVADQYIAAVMRRAEEKGWRMRRPSRGYVLRALT